MAYYTAGIVGPYVRNAITPSTFDISGGNISVTGNVSANTLSVAAFAPSNLAVPGYIRNDVAGSTTDISGGNIRITGTLSAGSITGSVTSTNLVVPGYIRDALTSTTLDISGGNISNSGRTHSLNIRVGPSNTFASQRGRIELIGGSDNAGGSGTPAMSIQYYDGGYRHFIRTRHNAAVGDSGNAVDVFTNDSTTDTTSTAPGTGNKLAISMTSGGVGVGTSAPAYNLDVSGTVRTTGGVVSTYLRNAITPTTYDISGGNISNSGTTTSTNAIVSGYVRNALTPSQFDISGGNISNSGTTRSSNFLGTATASNNIAGVTLSNRFVGVGIPNPTVQLDVSGTVRISATPEANIRVAAAGASDLNALSFYQVASEQGIYTSNTTPFTIYTQGSRRFTILSNGNVGISTMNPVYTLDVVGTTSATNVLVSGYLRNALTPSEFDISGGNISNSGRILTSSGTVSAPSYSFAADASMGLYDPATNVLGFATAGIERMRIDQSGNIAIGTSNPLTRVHILGTSNDASHGVVCIENNQAEDSNVGAGLSFKARYHNTLSVPSVIMGKIDALKEDPANYSDSFMAFSTRFDVNRPTGGPGELRERMRITSGGRMGINCNAPQNQLDICGIGTFDGIRITAAAPVINMYTRGSEANGNTMQFFANSSNGGLHQFDSGRTLNFLTNSTSRMAVGTNGFVAIGPNFSNPAYTLDVSAAASNAAVNIGTWPRMNTTSNFFWVRGHCNATVSTYRIRWNTTNSNVPNTNIMTWGDSATHGSYFQILKSGIWSINYVVQCTGTGFSWVDASSSFSNGYALPNSAGVGDLIALGPATGNTLVASFTGYLPGTASKFYRFSSTQANTNAGTGVITPYLTIALLYETPDIVPTFFSP